MRCPQCNKFVGMENGDPEANMDFTGGTISGDVRLTRNCAECSTELKDYTYSIEQQVDVPEGHEGEGHDLELEHDDPEVVESGGGRYAKNMIGVSFECRIRCSCQAKEADPLVTVTVEDSTNAGSFEECC